MIICSRCNKEYQDIDDIWFDTESKPVCKACMKEASNIGERQTTLFEGDMK